MRKLQVILTGGALPTIVAAMLAPVADGCGSLDVPGADASEDAVTSNEAGGEADEGGAILIMTDSGGARPWCEATGICPTIVPLPEPGTPADPGQLCAAPAPVSSNDAARITLLVTSPTTAKGFVAFPSTIEGRTPGPPVITVLSATSPDLAKMSVSSVLSFGGGGYTFTATWPDPVPRTDIAQSMMVQASFALACDDGGSQTIDSVTQISLCVDGDSLGWVSSGDACTLCCQIIAEMAPSPIVSDGRGDDLPLGRALRLRVIEIARTARQVLLFAENDAGSGAEYEWRVSEGTVERLADDVILWSLPEAGEAPFGQVAVWSETGAAVENFAWTRIGAAA